MLPYWTLGLFLLALIFKFLYYQSHAWPINPNCFTIKFLWPFDQDKDRDEDDRNEEDVEGNEILVD